MSCALCNGLTSQFRVYSERVYVRCETCSGIQILPEYYLSKLAEKVRYQLHENDITDPGYINFVSPVVNAIKENHSPTEAIGLDFGCGTGPVITSELEKAGFKINLYDPFFEKNSTVLSQQYDYIACCEVMEHFKQPEKEFRLLADLLKPDGKLYCKTSLFSDKVDFDNWHYKDDRTHVFIYSETSINWIAKNLNFKQVKIEPDLIIFTK